MIKPDSKQATKHKSICIIQGYFWKLRINQLTIIVQENVLFH